MLRLFRIHGHSLEPEYQPGDFVVTSKIPIFFQLLKEGDIISFMHPAFGLLIKRINRINSPTGQVLVEGSHPNSIDSREFGPISHQQILGKVIWHIHPKR